MDPRSMDHPFGPGPWTTSLDPVHGPPLWTQFLNIVKVEIITRLNQSEQLMKFKICVAQFLDRRDRRTTMVTDKQIAKKLNFSRIFLFFTTLTSAK